MISRRRAVYLLLLALCSAAAEDTPAGLVSKDSEHDLQAEATQSGSAAQKREASLSNSYGEPLPPDAYGPPKDLPNLVQDLPHPVPAPVYGVPDLLLFNDGPTGAYGPPPGGYAAPPPGAYGPPAPVSIPSQLYHGPPPPPQHRPKPIYGPPKPIYGPPKPVYGPPKYNPPKQSYGPPKKTYGPPKQSLPKPAYGVPFKPPKITLNKPLFGPLKPVYGPPKPVYGPPKINYGPPIRDVQSIPLPELPQVNHPPLDNNNLDFGLNLPAPIYGTPLVSLPVDLKPNFPIPSDSYGPPGHVLGPIGPNDQLVFQNVGNSGGAAEYGPPQPDAHPAAPAGVPAPPTPPRVLYDGWRPLPGLAHKQEIHINLDQPLSNVDQHHQFTSGSDDFLSDNSQFSSGSNQFSSGNHQFSSGNQQLSSNNHQFSSGAQISSGYANVHQDALANIDLNAIVGGDSNHIDQSKTVFEAHYTEDNQPDVSVVQFPGKPFDSYGAPPVDSFSSNGPYPASLRQQGAKGLVAPSGQYGVPPGSQYGAPPRPGPGAGPGVAPGLPLAYGQHSGGGHSGGSSPRKPLQFRESVPEGLFSHIAQSTQHKDAGQFSHSHAPAYLPPPIRDVTLSIEPTSLYSLPHAGSPVSFQHDSYSAPLLTVGVGDHVTSGSHTDAVTSTVDGTLIANLSNLDAAAILKHCPYHEAILRAARAGERIPADIASSYVNSLSSLGTTLNKSSNTVTIPDSFVQPTHKRESYNVQKSKSLKEKYGLKDERLQYVSDQIQKTSDRIRDLNEEAKQLQQKIVSTSQNIHSDAASSLSSLSSSTDQVGSYSVQIQSSNGGKSSVPHDQLLSEGLLQSILQAIDDPSKPGQKRLLQQQQQFSQQQQQVQQQQNTQQQQQLGQQKYQQQQFSQQQQQAQQQQNIQQQQQLGMQKYQQQQFSQQQQQAKQQQNIQQQQQLGMQKYQQQQFSQQQQQVRQQQNTQQQQQLGQQKQQQQQFSQQQQQVQQQQNIQQQQQLGQQKQQQQQFSQQQQQQVQQQQNIQQQQQLGQQKQQQQQFSQQQQQVQQQQNTQQQQFTQQQHSLSQQSQQQLPNSNVNLQSVTDGLVLPAGYEPVDHTKTADQDTQGSQHNKHIHSQVTHYCDLKTEGSSRSEVVVPAPNDIQSIDKDDGDVAVYFGDRSDVTEISAATSISEGDA